MPPASASRSTARAIAAGSALVGLAGGYMSVVGVKLWVNGMVGGRGWIAVALVVFARWAPVAGARRCAPVRLHRGGDPAYRRGRHSRAAIPDADDALSRDDHGDGLGGLRGNGAVDEPGALGQPHVREERR